MLHCPSNEACPRPPNRPPQHERALTALAGAGQDRPHEAVAPGLRAAAPPGSRSLL
jgi:hypothetical protein